MKNKIDLIEGFGFMFEVLFFSLAGFLYWINIYVSLLIFISGLITAYLVGLRIKFNAIAIKQIKWKQE